MKKDLTRLLFKFKESSSIKDFKKKILPKKEEDGFIYIKSKNRLFIMSLKNRKELTITHKKSLSIFIYGITDKLKTELRYHIKSMSKLNNLFFNIAYLYLINDKKIEEKKSISFNVGCQTNLFILEFKAYIIKSTRREKRIFFSHKKELITSCTKEVSSQKSSSMKTIII